MKRLSIIFWREYRMRIRRPSFWVLTLLVPVILAALYALPVLAARNAHQPTTLLVVDETGLFDGGLVGNDQVHFVSMATLQEAEAECKDRRGTVILHIPLRQTTLPHDAFLRYYGTAPSAAVERMVANQLQVLLRNAILEDVYQLEPSVYHSVESTHITLHSQDSATGRESFARVKSVVAAVLCVLLVLALLLFGVQTMRAVQEERQNRTVEVLATSVRPLLVLSGKLLAVAAVALTQLFLWMALTALCIKGIQASSPQLFSDARAQQEQLSLATKGEQSTLQYGSTVQLVDDTVQGLTAIRLPVVAILFVLCFLMAYLFYGSLLAALAARLDSDADALQWSLMVLSPLLVALALVPLMLSQPSGVMAQTLTLLPFTAPLATLARLPFGLPMWQAAVAGVLLMLCIALAALLAARTYRRRLLS